MLSDAIRRRLDQLNGARIVPVEKTLPGPLAGDRSPAGSSTGAIESAAEYENSAGKHLRLRRRLSARCASKMLAPYGTDARGVCPNDTALHPELAAQRQGFRIGAVIWIWRLAALPAR